MRERSSSSVRVYFPKYSRNEVAKLIRERLQTLQGKLPLQLVILFGSYAKGRYTASSDIDLLVTYEDPKRGDAYSQVWDAIRMPQLQLHLYTASEYEQLRQSGSAIPKEAEKGEIIWTGISRPPHSGRTPHSR